MKNQIIKLKKTHTNDKKSYRLHFRVIKYIIVYTLIFMLFTYTISFGADPTIVKKLNTAFGKIRDWMIKLATPAAAIAVGTGVFITKFSFGDDDRILKGKRLIRTTLYSYGFIIAVELILKAIDSLVG